MPARHVLLAIAVMTVWGSNFVVIKHGIGVMPPLLFAALRFALAVLPLAFVLPRPRVRWRNLAAYGTLIGAGQFGLLFIAMKGDITPGLASLVIQLQVFFTIGLSAWLAGERVRGHQWLALALAGSGLVVIGVNAGGSATPLGLALVILAAMSWAGGNMVAKAAGPVAMLPYVVWASLFPVPLLVLLSVVVEGPAAIAEGIARADWTIWAAVLWQSVGNTMFGYGVWGWLLARYPSASVAPLALLVPIFGIGTSALVLGEALQPWKLAATALVIGGLALGLLWRPRRATSAA
jgi:O-acetylserine/cysteine efflux transporter